MTDYPFSNWGDYLDAFRMKLSTWKYAEYFPNYAKISQTNIDIDNYIVTELLDKCPVDIDILFRTIIQGSRYAGEFKDTIIVMITEFVEHGAEINTHKSLLFKRQYSEPVSFEDEVIAYTARGMLIDIIHDLYPDIDLNYTDWSLIDATYWEHINIEGTWTEKHRLMYLKYCSEYLRTIL